MDRKEKMDRITQMLKEGVENVFSSENYKVFLKTMSRFPRYSLNNQILLYQQTGGTATYVAGYKKWQTFGRNVSKGEHGLLIIAPLPIKIETKSSDKEEETIMRFRATYVFDISQTTGEELPSLVRPFDYNSDSCEEIINKLIEFASIPVIFTSDLPVNVRGCFSPSENIIKVRNNMSKLDQCSTLTHEICHSMFDADPKTRLTKDEIEVRAQSVAYAVLSYLNIAPEVEDRYSFGYIASFSSRDLSELKTVIQDIRDATEKIITAIAPEPTAQEISS